MSDGSILKKTFVDFCEYDFEERMNHACRKIFKNKDVEIVTLSGPTCSGKTTMAKKLISSFTERDIRSYCISIDDYFLDRESCIADLDSIKAIDLDLLARNIRSLRNKKKTKIPAFDFKCGKRMGYITVDPHDYDVFVFEGIQAIYPEVAELMSAYETMSIYISVGEDPVVNGIRFDRTDIRLMRRLVRDYRFRAADASRTFNIWHTSVIPNEEANINPNVKNANVKISSYISYELFVLKPSLDKILSEIPEDSVYRRQADGILEKLTGFDDISEDLIPERSLYREFIG